MYYWNDCSKANETFHCISSTENCIFFFSFINTMTDHFRLFSNLFWERVFVSNHQTALHISLYYDTYSDKNEIINVCSSFLWKSLILWWKNISIFTCNEMRSKANVLFLDFFSLICAFYRTIDWNIGKSIKMGDNSNEVEVE